MNNENIQLNADRFLEELQIIENTDLKFRCKVKTNGIYTHDVVTKTLPELLIDFALQLPPVIDKERLMDKIRNAIIYDYGLSFKIADNIIEMILPFISSPPLNDEIERLREDRQGLFSETLQLKEIIESLKEQKEELEKSRASVYDLKNNEISKLRETITQLMSELSILKNN